MKGRLVLLIFSLLFCNVIQSQTMESSDPTDTIKANNWIDQIVALRKERKLKQALSEAKEAEQFILERLGETHKYYAKITYQLAVAYSGNYLFEEAIPIFKKTIALRYKYWDGEKRQFLATVINELGYALFQAQQFEKAFESFHKALEIQRAIDGGNSRIVADYYSNLGIAHQRTEEFQKAIGYLDSAIQIHESLPDQTIGLARAYNNIGIIYDLKGDYSMSELYFQKSLNLRLEKYSDNKLLIANAYGNYGNNLLNRGLYNDAIIFFEKAIKICEDGDNRDLACQESLFNTYTSLGRCLVDIKQDQKASNYLYKAMELGQKLFGSKDIRTLFAMSNIATQLDGVIENGKRIELYKEVIRSFELIFDKPSSYELAPTRNLGQLYFSLGDYKTAAVYFEKALGIASNVYSGFHKTKAWIIRDLAVVHRLMGNYRYSIDLLKDVVKQSRENIGLYHPFTAESYRRLSLSYQADNFLQEALNYADSAIVAANYQPNGLRNISDAPEILASLTNKVGLLRQLADEEGNSEYLIEATEILDETFETLHKFRRDQSFRKSDVYLSHLSYGDAIGVCHGLQREFPELREDAFLYLQRSKSARLYAALQESNAKRFTHMPKQLLLKEERLKADITSIEKKRKLRLDAGSPATGELVLGLSDQLFKLKRKYDQLMDTLERQYPKYYRLKYDFTTASLAYVQDTLLETGQTLLEYFVADSSIYAFIIQEDNYELIELEKNFSLEDLVRQLQNGLSGFYGQSKMERTDNLFRETLTDYIHAATSLYAKLIAPLEEKLGEKVIIVPDGILGYVPFETLLEQRPEKLSAFDSYPFWLQKHHISYCYSATLLREMTDKVRRRTPQKTLGAFAPFATGNYADIKRKTEIDLLQLANGQDSMVYKEIITRKDFHQLPSSGSEAYLAAKIWDGDAFVGEDATEDHFNTVAGDYRILHLSTHGIADERVGDYSYLAFAEQKDSVENEFLYVRDLYNLQLNADLVVLSACETANGELKGGEGIISLARAFAYAGAKSMLTTLWVVDDAVAKDLTRDFYIHLKQGKTKDRSLYLAKQQHLKRSDNSRKHPFFWAAMIPVGDMSPLK